MNKEKSKYELKLEALIAQSTSFSLTQEENIQVLKDLSMGMEDFLYEEKKIETQSKIELRGLVLNA
jgi:hypothetical protein